MTNELINLVGRWAIARHQALINCVCTASIIMTTTPGDDKIINILNNFLIIYDRYCYCYNRGFCVINCYYLNVFSLSLIITYNESKWVYNKMGLLTEQSTCNNITLLQPLLVQVQTLDYSAKGWSLYCISGHLNVYRVTVGLIKIVIV